VPFQGPFPRLGRLAPTLRAACGMHLTPDLRPAGPKLERSDSPTRERSCVEAPSTRSRFDEHLQQAGEQGQTPGAKREREQAPARAARPEEAAAASERSARAEPASQTAESARPRFAAAPEAALDPTATVPDSQSRVEIDGGALDSAVPQALEQPLPLFEADAEASAEVQAAPSAPAADPLEAALLSLKQATRPQPGLLILSPAATSLPAGILAESVSTEEAGAPTAPASLESSPAALLPAADEGTRAHFATSEGAREFEAELTRLRESEAAVAPGRAQAQREQAAEILRQVRVGLSPDLREANIQLAPESLGRVTIQLRVEDGVLHAEVRAQTPEALRALERHAPELKAALAQNGVEARSLEFQLESPSSRAGDGHARGGAAHAHSARQPARPFAPPPAALERALLRGLSASGIDTFA